MIGIHWITYRWAVFLVAAAILALYIRDGLEVVQGAVALSVIMATQGYLRRRNTHLSVLPKKLVLHKGVLSVSVTELNAKVSEVRTEQGTIGKILNYGKLTVIGRGSPPLTIEPIDDPQATKAALIDYLARNARLDDGSDTGNP